MFIANWTKKKHTVVLNMYTLTQGLFLRSPYRGEQLLRTLTVYILEGHVNQTSTSRAGKLSRGVILLFGRDMMEGDRL